MEINQNDLLIEALRYDVGGQHTNGPEHYPVRVTHVPTGISATVEARTPFYSRQIAMEMVEYALAHEGLT